MKKFQTNVKSRRVFLEYYLGIFIITVALICVVVYLVRRPFNLWAFFITYGALFLLISFSLSNIQYIFQDNVLKIRTKHMVQSSLSSEDIAQIICYSRIKYNLKMPYTHIIVDQDGNRYYLFPEKAKELVAVLRNSNPSIELITRLR
ncbi:hypothetical protein [uncultured Bacteroides sp.]|uniref:hypothetical protein n=1 Tax=uncultured Bacteroides sp. TaxID=162156 RepID=UPI00260E1BD5|nr:hypothetical protein [uncultured Bacteroides sp.]